MVDPHRACLRACVSVCRSVTTVSLTKTDEPIEVLFALSSSVRSAPSLLQFRRNLKTALHVSVIVLFTIVFSCVTDCNCNL